MTVLAALAEAWLADRPHGGVDAAYGLLLDVRDAVHVVTGRGRDRLGREDHDAVAALLGHHDADDLLTAVSGAGRLIAYSLDGTLRRAGSLGRGLFPATQSFFIYGYFTVGEKNQLSAI